MGPRLFTKKIGGTFYSLAAIPLGGYVRPLYRYAPGKDPNSTPPKALTFLIQCTEEESKYVEKFTHNDSGNYLNASARARAFFLVNGVIFNFLFCIALMVLQYYQTAPLNRLYKGSYVGIVVEGSFADKQGIKKDDQLVKVDDVAISSWQDLYDYVKHSKASEVTAVFERTKPEPKQISLSVDPSLLVMKKYHLERYFLTGFEPASFRLKPTLAQSLYYGTTATFEILLSPFRGSGNPVTEDASFSDKVEKEDAVSFGLIIPSYELGKESSQSWYQFLVALFSINLLAAVLNIIPYPAFDGGHLAILLVESISKTEINMAWKERLAHFGLSTSLLLIVIALGADIWNGASFLVSWLG